MTPNHPTAMSFDASSFSGSESARRKTYAIVGAAVCVLVLVIAYAFSGSKPAPKKVVEPDQPLASIDGQTLVDLDQPPADKDWYENVPAGTIVAQNPQAGAHAKDAPTTPVSSVVIGDNPAAEPPAESVMKPGEAPGPGVVAQTGAGSAAEPVSGGSAQGTDSAANCGGGGGGGGAVGFTSSTAGTYNSTTLTMTSGKGGDGQTGFLTVIWIG